MNKVDVVIPVYNAIDYAIKCIDSIYQHAAAYINKVIVMDDASSAETRRKLDEIKKPGLEVIHNEKNLGFGGNVNKGVNLATADLVLILNSDTVAEDDFLKPLIESMVNDPKLVAVNPCFPEDVDKQKKYQEHKGLIKSYMLTGYAILVWRKGFQDVGGFNPVFGRGYYEDSALARDLNQGENYTGINIKSILKHEGSKSFPAEEVEALGKKNGEIFRKMYPESNRKIMIITGKNCNDLDNDHMAKVDDVCKKGGKVFYFSNNNPLLSPNKRVELRSSSLSEVIGFLNRAVIRGYKRPHTKITELWIDEEISSCCFSVLLAKYICKKKLLVVKSIKL